MASEFRLYLMNEWVATLPSHHLRLFFYRHLMGLRIGPGTAIFMECRLDCAGGITIGKNTTINRDCRLDGRGTIKIGDYVTIAAQVRILTADHDPDCPEFGGRDAEVVIDDFCFIGTGAIILKGVHLGTGAFIGAGSVVARDVPAGEIWAGNPARKLRDRKLTAFYECPPFLRLFQ